MNYFFISLLYTVLLWGCVNTEGKKESGKPSKALKQISVYDTSVPEPSGLVYNARNNSLMTVSDGNSTVYEIDFKGNITKSLKVPCIDLEGIALSKNCDTILVVDEATSTISKFLSNGTRTFSKLMDVHTKKNNGLEGITVDKENHVWIINEKNPCMLIELDGNKKLKRYTLNYSTDISDIFYDETTNILWVLSDESKKIFTLNMNGKLISEFSIPMAKGEGITVVKNKIYIISDSDSKLYVFEKPRG